MELSEYQQIFKDAIKQRKVLILKGDDLAIYFHVYALRSLSNGFQIIADKEVFNLNEESNISMIQRFDVNFVGTKGLEGLALSNLDLDKKEYLHRFQAKDPNAIGDWFTIDD